jgi:hypothetical protein
MLVLVQHFRESEFPPRVTLKVIDRLRSRLLSFCGQLLEMTWPNVPMKIATLSAETITDAVLSLPLASPRTIPLTVCQVLEF